jgi:hypothetical protein
MKGNPLLDEFSAALSKGYDDDLIMKCWKVDCVIGQSIGRFVCSPMHGNRFSKKKSSIPGIISATNRNKHHTVVNFHEGLGYGTLGQYIPNMNQPIP